MAEAGRFWVFFSEKKYKYAVKSKITRICDSFFLITLLQVNISINRWIKSKYFILDCFTYEKSIVFYKNITKLKIGLKL